VSHSSDDAVPPLSPSNNYNHNHNNNNINASNSSNNADPQQQPASLLVFDPLRTSTLMRSRNGNTSTNASPRSPSQRRRRRSDASQLPVSPTTKAAAQRRLERRVHHLEECNEALIMFTQQLQRDLNELRAQMTSLRRESKYVADEQQRAAMAFGLQRQQQDDDDDDDDEREEESNRKTSSSTSTRRANRSKSNDDDQRNNNTTSLGVATHIAAPPRRRGSRIVPRSTKLRLSTSQSLKVVADAVHDALPKNQN
jgi:hypothetical protein